MLWIFTNVFFFTWAWLIIPHPVIVWIGFSSYYHTILVLIVIVRLLVSPVFVSMHRTQPSSVRPHPVTFFGRVRKSNPVIIVSVGRQNIRFYEIIFFTRVNLYQISMPFFAFLLGVFPCQLRCRKQFITERPVANPPLLTSWVKKQ